MANILINTACCTATCGTVTNPCTCPGQPVVELNGKTGCGIISPKSCFLDSFIPVENGSPIIYYKVTTSSNSGNFNETTTYTNIPSAGGGAFTSGSTIKAVNWSSTTTNTITGGEQSLNEDCSIDQEECSTTVNCGGGEYSETITDSYTIEGGYDHSISYYNLVYSITASYGPSASPEICVFSGSWSIIETITIDGETTTYTDGGPTGFISTDYQNCYYANCSQHIFTTQTAITDTITGSIVESSTWEPVPAPWGGEVTPSSSVTGTYNNTTTTSLSSPVQCNPEELPKDVANCNYDNYADWGAPSSIVPINGDDPSPAAFEPFCVHAEDETVINPTTCAFCLGDGKLTWTDQIQEGYQIEITLCFTNLNDAPCENGTTYTLTSDVTEITFPLEDFMQEEIQGNPVANVGVICITNAVYSQITGP